MEREETKQIEVFFKINSLKLKEEIEDLYIYQDCIKSEFSIFYNDELKVDIDLYKILKKKTRKLENFETIKDIKIQFNNEEQLVKIIFYK